MKKRFLLVLLAAFTALSLFAKENYNWDKAERLQQGVRLIRFQLDEPRLMRVAIMRVDLSIPGLTWISTPRDPDWGKPMPDYPGKTICALRMRTADFMLNARKPLAEGGLNLNVVVAANAAPWSPWCDPYTHKYSHPVGINVTNGEILSHDGDTGAVFIVTKQGKVGIESSLDEKHLDKVHLAVSGFGLLLKNGEKVAPGGYQKGLMPRMCYGLSRDKRYLYLMTIDGRQEGWSLGAKGYEMAEILLKAGAYDAIDMDGGGSATLCYYDKKEHKPVVVNRHSESGYTRPVGSNIGIALPGPVRK